MARVIKEREARAHRARCWSDEIGDRMKRRELMLLLGGAAVTVPLVVRAQQKAMPVIGYLSGGNNSPSFAPMRAAFRQGLSETGYVEGQNLAIEYRRAEGHSDRLPALAADLADRRSM